MPQRNYPKSPHVKIDFYQRDEDLIEKMATIIQNEKKINSYSLRKSLELSITKFYHIQRACLEKYPKTLLYDKKEKAYCFCAYVPKIEIKQKIQQLEKELTV